ncbi:hypothetical protein Ferp_0428 [Ferroglobus placidus DSM 10642]|uniref:Uncharacterized protein n=1 Tax=Ferroglobus placidus (strain DSM 10642 / AEDII12DO) TaxID=589924 RepID=D3S2X1_FERPA|nr:hypothetical protein [Ferroglobus placidus]ADC64604.1 hypothetical protein Ferp_0428 [Ferroglobus placidus DSM 10642]
MIPETEINSFINTILSERPFLNTFKIPTLQIYHKGGLIKLGTRSVYVDFPRGVYELQRFLLELCNRVIESAGHDYQNGTEMIKSQKADPKSDINFLTSILEKFRIKWSITFLPYYKKPVIKFYVNGYFKSLWPFKLKSFVEELNQGRDSPKEIYEKARTLTPEFLRVSEAAKRETLSKIPSCFELLFNSSLSPYSEIQGLVKLMERLYRIAEKVEDMLFQYLILESIADLKTSLHNLMRVLESGYAFGCYPLLRKFLTSFSYAIFLHSFYMYMQEHKTPEELYESDKEDLREALLNYAANFLQNGN